MNHRGVLAAPLGAEGFFYRFVDIAHAHDCQHRHEHFGGHKRVIAIDLGDDQPRVAGEANARVAQDHRRVAPDVFAVDDVVPVLVDERSAHHLVDVLAGNAEGADPFHFAHQPVGDVREGENFLLRNAQNVVIKGCAIHDALSCVGKIGGVVHDDGGIAGACRDDLFAGLHRNRHDRLAAGNAQQRNVLMVHDNVAAFQRRLFHRGDERRRTAGGYNRLYHQAHRFLRGAFRRGMGIEDHRVARRNHTDGVIDDGRCGVCRGGDGADDAEGSLLDEYHALVARLASGHQILDAGGAPADEQILLHLVGNTSVSGFFMGEPCEIFGVVDARLAHGGNQLAALFQCHFGELRLRGLGVGHRFLRSVAQPAAGAAVRLRRRGRRFLLHGFRKASHDFIRDLPDLLFCQCHGCFSFPESGSSRARDQ